jgi:hypothetical protein
MQTVVIKYDLMIEICFQTFIFLTFENKKISNTCPQSLAGNELIHLISTDGHHELSIYMATSAAIFVKETELTET